MDMDWINVNLVIFIYSFVIFIPPLQVREASNVSTSKTELKLHYDELTLT